MLLYNDLAEAIVADVAHRLPEFRHLDASRIAVLAAARCTKSPTGNLATCYGLPDDAPATFSVWVRRRSKTIAAVSRWYRQVAPRVILNERPMRYLILLRLPRYFKHHPLKTLIHELYHIGEQFDGRLRPERHGPRFDRAVRQLMNRWLATAPPELSEPALMQLEQLQRRYGSVLALGVPPRFRVPLTEAVHANHDHWSRSNLDRTARREYREAVARLHPELRLSPLFEIRPAKVDPPSSPRLITENDLVLRHYTTQGIQRVPAAFARHTRNRTTFAEGLDHV